MNGTLGDIKWTKVVPCISVCVTDCTVDPSQSYRDIVVVREAVDCDALQALQHTVASTTSKQRGVEWMGIDLNGTIHPWDDQGRLACTVAMRIASTVGSSFLRRPNSVQWLEYKGSGVGIHVDRERFKAQPTVCLMLSGCRTIRFFVGKKVHDVTLSPGDALLWTHRHKHLVHPSTSTGVLVRRAESVFSHTISTVRACKAGTTSFSE